MAVGKAGVLALAVVLDESFPVECREVSPREIGGDPSARAGHRRDRPARLGGRDQAGEIGKREPAVGFEQGVEHVTTTHGENVEDGVGIEHTIGVRATRYKPSALIRRVASLWRLSDQPSAKLAPPGVRRTGLTGPATESRRSTTMSELPDDFTCTVTNWEYIYGRCRAVADEVKRSGFEPEVVVALARGGWFAGRCLCDFLGLDDLTSLKIEHYVGTAAKSGEPEIRYPMPEGSVDGKNVLIIDDIADTGGSIEHAHEYVTDREPDEVRTATLQLLGTSDFEPDYVGERLDGWAWIVYPWNFIEDMIDLVSGVMEHTDREAVSTEAIRDLLADHHDLDRIGMEVAQPNRLGEVLAEMHRRDVIEPTDTDEWRLVD